MLPRQSIPCMNAEQAELKNLYVIHMSIIKYNKVYIVCKVYGINNSCDKNHKRDMSVHCLESWVYDTKMA